MEMPKTNATAFQTLKDNWFLIVFFMGMAVTWGSFSQKDKVQEARIEILEVKAEKNDDLRDPENGFTSTEEIVKGESDNKFAEDLAE